MALEANSDDVDVDYGFGTSIIRWEAASGLGESCCKTLTRPKNNTDIVREEHTCYACPTKANHPKARQSCYGIHSIPCSRYHPTMHAVGTSHNCFACIQADNQHELRHRKARSYETTLEDKTNVSDR
jgi:hypothetical protein